jgi:hypothetical protein
MAYELIGAKLLAPFFGTSLYVWAAALALTLGGFTIGYFSGGCFSKKYAGSYSFLYWVLIGARLLLVIMPFTSELIVNQTINLSLAMGLFFPCSFLCYLLWFLWEWFLRSSLIF